MSVILEKFNVNPLAFLTQAKWYDHLRAYSYGQIKPVLAPQGTIPPFQIVKIDSSGIAEIKLISFDTQAETEIKAEMTLTGFEFLEPAGKDYYILRYPGTVPVPGIATTEGLWYLRMQDYNGNYILSELFSFIDDIEDRRDILKIQWWHQENFEYGNTTTNSNDVVSTGHIQYDFPFKFWAYVKADIAKPTYQFENRVVNRKGVNLPLEQVRFKLHQFVFFQNESFADAFSLVPLHDQVRITHMGREYDPDEFSVDVEFSGNGDVAIIKCEFKTDSVVQINGRAYTDIAYEEANGTCLESFICAAIVTQGSTEYNNFQWTGSNGTTNSLSPGQLVIIDNAGVLTVKQYNGAAYVSAGGSDYDTYYTVNDSRTGQVASGDYYFFLYSGTLLDAPQLLTYNLVGSTATVTGRSFGNSLVQIILKDENGNEWIGVTGTDTAFLSPGLSFSITNQGRTGTAYKARALSYVCGQIADSDWQELDGVDFDEIGDDLEVYPGGSGDTIPDPFEIDDN